MWPGICAAAALFLGAPDWAERALDRGVEAFRAGDYPRALVDLAVAARAPGIDPAVHLYLGYTLFKLDRFEEATARVRQALAADPSLDGPLPRFYLGLSLYRRRLYLTAREDLQRVVDVSGAGRLAAQARQFIDAIDAAAARARSDAAAAYHDLGLAALAERPGAAADVFAEALGWLARSSLPPEARENQRRETAMYLTLALCLAGRCAEAARRLAGDPAARTSKRLELARALARAGAGDLEAARKVLAHIARRGSPRLRAAAQAFLGALRK
jgi:tetratricopeptide (TPR) repeat protein